MPFLQARQVSWHVQAMQQACKLFPPLADIPGKPEVIVGRYPYPKVCSPDVQAHPCFIADLRTRPELQPAARKKRDVVIIDCGSQGLQPLHSPCSNAVTHADGQQACMFWHTREHMMTVALAAGCTPFAGLP